MNIKEIKKIEENKVCGIVTTYTVTLSDNNIIFVPLEENNADYQVVKEFLKYKQESKK